MRASPYEQLEVESVVQRLEDALGLGVAALEDSPEAQALVGQPLARREIDARDLEERDALGADVEPGSGGFDETGEKRRPE